MSSTTDKIKGTANEVAGKAKQGVDEATDNQSLKNEGDTQEIKGKGQKVVGDVKDGVKKAGNL
ncbi:CsbD family protein [Pseudomonas luteola]|uniref:CsbD family protein n=1 Tax=Pseudomonas luteola TaxID=47886 RepID=UPI001EF71FCC|nr:CsbD family protein [Pseudomonas luteola]MCG7373690.1 CsbD family protein [Pseudomonas luteola]